MPYLGNQPSSGGYHKLDNLTASATDTYALTLGGSAYYPATANQLMVSLNGVIQAPQDSFTISGSNIVFASALSASDSIDFIMSFGDVYGVGTPADGTITNAKIQSMAASKLTGALPAIDGSALTGISAGIVKTAISRIDATASRSGTSLGELADFGSFTPSQTTSTVYILGNANFGAPASQYFGACFFINGTAYRSTDNSMLNYYASYPNNGYNTHNVSIFTSVDNTDGSAITVTVHTRGGSTQYINRSSTITAAVSGSNPVSEIMFVEALV